jgi:hypothetical protein
MQHLRIFLHFTAEDSSAEALIKLRGYLSAMVEHQDLGVHLGGRELERLGLSGVRLTAADLDPGGGERDENGRS